MEVYFDSNESYYQIGDKEIPITADTGELSMLRGRVIGDTPVWRVFKNICFGGAAVTDNPAERRAHLLAVASNKALTDGKELFVDLKDADFALSSKRMFPLDKSEHVKASLSYFNDFATALVNEVPANELAEAHERLVAAAEKFGLEIHEVTPLSERDDKGNVIESLANETVKEDCKTMADKENEHLVEEVDETAVAEEETPEVEAVEEIVDETPEAEAIEDVFDMRTAFEELKGLVSQLIPSAVEEVAEASEEKDELTLANERIAELEAELETARADKASAEASLVGHTRLTELKEAGMSIASEETDSRVEFLAGLSDDAYQVYLTDIKAVAAKTDTQEIVAEETEEATASLNLEDDADAPASDKYSKYREMWRSTKVHARYES